MARLAGGLYSLARGVSADLAPMWFLFALLGIEVLWATAQGLNVVQLADALCLVILPIAVGLALNASGKLSRLANFFYYFGFWKGTLLAGTVLGYLAASLRFGLLDGAFEALDAQLGFHWVAWFNYQQDSPTLSTLFKVVYLTMVPQILFAIIYFSKPSRSTQARQLWWACIVALVIADLVSGLLPALGSYQRYGIWMERAVHLPDLLAIRQGTLTTLPLLELKGLVTLPSFHSAMAVLLAWAYRREGLLFALACAVNAAMLVSVPTHGGHYLVDVISGCSVAALAIFLVTSADGLKKKAGRWMFASGAGLGRAYGIRSP